MDTDVQWLSILLAEGFPIGLGVGFTQACLLEGFLDFWLGQVVSTPKSAMTSGHSMDSHGNRLYTGSIGSDVFDVLGIVCFIVYYLFEIAI